MVEPDFIVIGASRSGTTWLYDCLKEHPNVFLPKTKRIYFFNDHYEKGLSYYADFFKNAKDKGQRVVGECCTAYLADPTCPGKICSCLKQVKLIAILRDPVKRAFSEYLAFHRPYCTCSFEEAIEKWPYLLERGMYYDHLRRYYAHFEEGQVFVLLHDDIQREPFESIKALYRFLGVDDQFVPSNVNRPLNVTVFPTVQTTLKRLRAGWIIKILKKSPLDKTIRRMAQRKIVRSYPRMNPHTQNRLSKYFRSSNEKLSLLIERDLSSWI